MNNCEDINSIHLALSNYNISYNYVDTSAFLLLKADCEFYIPIIHQRRNRIIIQRVNKLQNIHTLIDFIGYNDFSLTMVTYPVNQNTIC